MNMKLLFTTMAAILPAMASATTPFVGLYQTIDDKPIHQNQLLRCMNTQTATIPNWRDELSHCMGQMGIFLKHYLIRHAQQTRSRAHQKWLDWILYETGDMRQEYCDK